MTEILKKREYTSSKKEIERLIIRFFLIEMVVMKMSFNHNQEIIRTQNTQKALSGYRYQ